MKYFYLSISRKPEKKYMITYINDITGRLNTIYFGNAGSSDFLISNNWYERHAYLKRHKTGDTLLMRCQSHDKPCRNFPA